MSPPWVELSPPGLPEQYTSPQQSVLITSFYFLFFDTLTAKVLLILETLPLPGLASS